jgi:ech hydrogenase subunit A
MVAPTPVSALLHSSTMVKAGVYLILRLAPVLAGSVPGLLVALVGGVTFLLASLIAVAQSDAKKILAYSTVANLGLIVLCGGVGTYEALWAGVLLLVFHAVAKALLFLCVGTVEHRIGSRDVEAMSGMVVSAPRLSIMMQIGMAGMFLAPFGMLISKYAVLKALIDYNPILTVFLVFGSGATLFFWVKWMGKLLVVTRQDQNVERGTSRAEWFPLATLSGLTVALCGFFPLLSSYFVEPYVREVYGVSAAMNRGNIVIMVIMLALVALFPLTFVFYNRKVHVMEAYLGGANAGSSTSFTGSMGEVREAGMRNYYLERYFGEKRLLVAGMVICGLLLVFMVGGAFRW